MTKARDLANLIAAGNTLSDGAITVAEISDLTASAADLNNLAGINTSVQTQLDGKQAVVAGVSSTEIGYLDGVTSALQTQLNNISVTSGSLTKSFTSGETASITLAQAISPAPVVSATKEVAQAGISSKGAWDVDATASNYDFHDTATAVTLTPSVSVFTDISNATFSKDFSTASQTTSLLGLSFLSNGTKMYVAGASYVYQYNLSTAWDLDTASYSNYSLDYSSYDTTTEAFFIKPDGTKAWFIGRNSDQVRLINFSSAGEINSGTISSDYFSVVNEEANPTGLTFKSDGTKMYIIGTTGDDVNEYALSTAWDVTTASYTQNFSTASQDHAPSGVSFDSTGTKMYVAGEANNDIFLYNLSTAWDVSTASYSNTLLDISSRDSSVQDVFVGDNNSKIYVVANVSNKILQYENGSTVLTLGSGSFASTDVGKRIVGNGGDVTLTSTAGAYSTTGGSAFTDSSTIASGSWTMRGLKSAGDADGIGLNEVIELGALNIDEVTYVNLANVGAQDSDPRGIRLSNDGTKMFMAGFSNNEIFEYNLSTAFDVSTASYNNISYVLGGTITSLDVVFNNDGTKMYVPSHTPSPSRVYEYNLSTAFDLSTVSTTSNTLSLSSQTGTGAVHGICFNDDGTKFYVSASSSYVYQYALTTAFDLSTGSYVQSYNANAQVSDITGVNFNKDGTSMYILDNSSDDLYQYNLTTPYDVSTASYSNKSLEDGTGLVQDSEPEGFCFSSDFTKMYLAGTYGNRIYGFSTSFSETVVQSTSQYHIATTNSGGQIDTNFWNDINSMTADQTAGDGTVHYAVSTDDRTTWSVARASDGVRPIVRDNSGTWQYNSQETSVAYDIGNASVTSSEDFGLNNVYGISFNDDGTKVYFCVYDNSVRQYGLSTAYDLTTLSHQGNASITNEGNNGLQMQFKPDGTKFFTLSFSNNKVVAFHLTGSAWDVYSGHTNTTKDIDTSWSTSAMGLAFNSDGTSFYICSPSGTKIGQFNMTTAWDVTTAPGSPNTTFTDSTNIVSGDQNINFNSTGTKLYILNTNQNVKVFNLSTAWDISTAVYSSTLQIPNHSSITTSRAFAFNSDGSRMILSDEGGGIEYVYSTGGTTYSTSTTWANATTNDEFYALQQALGATAVNRMDKTQLDAVADGSHFTLGDTLDLAIALRQDTASTSTPKSDGVSINYDAAALNQGAVLGTDYDYDFPNSTTVRVTSNAAQNLKVRVV